MSYFFSPDFVLAFETTLGVQDPGDAILEERRSLARNKYLFGLLKAGLEAEVVGV